MHTEIEFVKFLNLTFDYGMQIIHYILIFVQLDEEQQKPKIIINRISSKRVCIVMSLHGMLLPHSLSSLLEYCFPPALIVVSNIDMNANLVLVTNNLLSRAADSTLTPPSAHSQTK